MSTTTVRTPKSIRKPAPKSTPAPADVPRPSTDAPPFPVVDAPTLQETLNVSAVAPALHVETVESGDANSVAFLEFTTKLAACIQRQNASMVAWYVERGRYVQGGIDVKVSKGTNKPTRTALRASAINAMTIVAESTYDASSEPAPKLDRWVSLAALADLYPDATNLPSVRVADALAACITRIDPPAAWNAPERYEVKHRYDAAALGALISRTVREGLTLDMVNVEIERIGGAVEPDAPADRTDDPVKAARSLAASILERIQDRKIDAETFFDELQSQLTKFGWALVKDRSANGAETFKPVKTAR